jgi:multidrug transporter EmrE-like cation transporter
MLGLSIMSSIAGQALLKAGAAAGDFRAQVFDLRSLAGLGAYGVAALFYMLALRRLPMSVALPLTATTYVGAVVIGCLAFGERLNPAQTAGIAAIGFGVLLLGVGSA